MARKFQFSQKALANIGKDSQEVFLYRKDTYWSYMLLGSLTLLLFIFFIWLFLGRIAESVEGDAITLLNDGMHQITAPEDGHIRYLNITAGAKIDVHQVVGQITDSDALFKLRKLEQEYLVLEDELKYLTKIQEGLLDEKLSVNERKIQYLEQLLRINEISGNNDNSDIVILSDSIKDNSNTNTTNSNNAINNNLNILQPQTGNTGSLNISLNASSAESKNSELSRKGSNKVISPKNAESMDYVNQVYHELHNRMIQDYGEDFSIKKISLELASALNEVERKRNQKKVEFELAEKLFKDNYWIHSNARGQVVEVFHDEGDYVHKGDNIALLSGDVNKGIYLVAYIPTQFASKVHNGMRAYFEPVVAPASKYGYIKAVVRETSEMPSNEETIAIELMNRNFAKQITKNGSVHRIILELIPNIDSPNGYESTSQFEYQELIRHGMFGKVVIDTNYKTPATLLIPALREFFGGSSSLATE